MAGPTKAGAALDACQEIAQNTILEGATVDLSASYEHLLQIWWALCNATAHTGSKIIPQVSSIASGDEDWSDLQSPVVGIGTTNLEVITNNPLAAAGTTITMADTTGYTVNGSWRFLEDVSTFANSEWVFQKTVSANTNITIVDGVAREHAVNSIMNSVAGCLTIPLPFGSLRARVLYDNTYDADGATLAIRSRIITVTAVS